MQLRKSLPMVDGPRLRIGVGNILVRQRHHRLGTSSREATRPLIVVVARHWNAGAIRIFGFGVEEAIGRPLDIIIPENLLPLHWQGYRYVMETGRYRYGEGEIMSVPALTKSGRRISVEFTITAVRDDEVNLIGLVAIMRDVTTRFQELKLLRSKVAASGHPQSSS
jgi:PAS domain S-box-containing protein